MRRMKKGFFSEKNIVFICEIGKDYLSLIKCLYNGNSGHKFLGFNEQKLPADINDADLSGTIKNAFKKLEYKGSVIILSLPRSSVTCRYIKIPTHIPHEVEKIIRLQASQYLPYSANELITGYKIIDTNDQGYSEIHLIIAYRDIINRYIKIFDELKPSKFSIALSSYGICNLYLNFKPKDHGSVMIVDVGSSFAELVIVSKRKLLFSRSFKCDNLSPDWANLLINEVDKSRNAYLKEVSREPPQKIILSGARKIYQEFARILKEKEGLPVETLPYERLNFAGGLLDKILASGRSFSSILGFGMSRIPDSLNLLPHEKKEEAKKFSRTKKRLHLGLFILGIVLVLGVAVAKNLDNKALYLERLKIELDKIKDQALPLEDMERRLKVLEGQIAKRTSSIDILYELYQIIPGQISLINFNYEDGRRVILRGQTSELKSVVNFASRLRKSPIFGEFNIRVRYATKQRKQSGEVIDFEIVCLKE